MVRGAMGPKGPMTFDKAPRNLGALKCSMVHACMIHAFYGPQGWDLGPEMGLWLEFGLKAKIKNSRLEFGHEAEI